MQQWKFTVVGKLAMHEPCCQRMLLVDMCPTPSLRNGLWCDDDDSKFTYWMIMSSASNLIPTYFLNHHLSTDFTVPCPDHCLPFCLFVLAQHSKVCYEFPNKLFIRVSFDDEGKYCFTNEMLLMLPNQHPIVPPLGAFVRHSSVLDGEHYPSDCRLENKQN